MKSASNHVGCVVEGQPAVPGREDSHSKRSSARHQAQLQHLLPAACTWHNMLISTVHALHAGNNIHALNPSSSASDVNDAVQYHAAPD